MIYKALYGERGTWVRPLSMWENLIDVDGKTVKRFEYLCEKEETEKRHELEEARRALQSTLNKCEKMDMSKLGKSQRTLLERRITALKVAIDLIEKESESRA